MGRIASLDELIADVRPEPDVRRLLRLRPSDVVIVPFAKSGTTWVQQIVHTLRTGGDMDFDDISRVIPFLEANERLGLDLDAEQRAEPRAFKTHVPWERAPRGGRYINVVRDPRAAAVSAFNFMEGSLLERGAVTVDEFAEHWFLARRTYYAHLRSWWRRRLDEDVLYLVYEQMLADPETAIVDIAAFIGVDLDDNLLATTVTHSSRPFMLRHQDRFDDAMLVATMGEGTDLAKVTAGSSVDDLGETILARFEEVWHDEIESSLGLGSYADLVAAIGRGPDR